MCDQIPVEVCNRLTPEELMSLELLQCQRRNVEENSTVLTFLVDTMKGENPAATINDRIIVALELSRLIRCADDYSTPDIPKFSSKDLLRLGYGCAHAAD